jgi:hypothetical protein
VLSRLIEIRSRHAIIVHWNRSRFTTCVRAGEARTLAPMRTWTFPERRPATDGPWTAEPDKAQWVDEATGLDCLIVRNWMGTLCGYVGLPPGHRLHGVDYDAVYKVADVEVHGGLTFADSCQEGAEDGPGVCHVPEPGRPAEVWWLGFDCGHVFDLVPSMREVYAQAGIDRTRVDPEWEDVYRDFGYVQAEVASLARQLAAAASV